MGMIYKRGAVWWIKYYRNGIPMRESARTDKETEAKRLLRLREGAIERGEPVTPRVGRVRFDELVDDLVNDYRVNDRRSLRNLQRIVKLHLTPFFDGRRVASITTADVRRFILQRREVHAASAEINRELAALKRAFSLGIQGGKLLYKPYIPMLQEDNVRTGFFERAQFEAVRDRLALPLRPVVTFAYLTGWRIPSEVLTLQWRQIDFTSRIVRLDAGTTKNREGRVFPFTAVCFGVQL
jgi:integrase